MSHVVVGVDAGGTKTAVAHRVDSGPVRVLTGGGASATTLGAGRAAAIVCDLIERSLDGAQPRAIFVGMAGGGSPAVANAVREAIQSRFQQARVDVRDDAAIALRASVPSGDGAVLIAGTGSIAYAERGSEMFRCGGYGYLVGDEGSGFAIGASGVRHLLRVYDARAKRDRLAQAIEDMLDVRDAQSVLAYVYGAARPVAAIAAAGMLVVQLAGEGERSATKIVQGAALELGDLIKAVLRAAGLAQSPVPLALAGGLFAQNSILSYLLETRLTNELPAISIRKDGTPPYEGALTLAQRLAQ